MQNRSLPLCVIGEIRKYGNICNVIPPPKPENPPQATPLWPPPKRIPYIA